MSVLTKPRVLASETLVTWSLALMVTVRGFEAQSAGFCSRKICPVKVSTAISVTLPTILYEMGGNVSMSFARTVPTNDPGRSAGYKWLGCHIEP